MRRRITMLVAGTALGFACASPGPPPPYFVRSEIGIVQAHDPGTARSFESLCRSALPQVHAALPGLVERPIDLWILTELGDDSAHGLTWPDRIELTSETPEGGRLFILSHELVHYLVDDVWDRLPHVIEEGLCDWAAMCVDPERAIQRRAEHGILLATAVSGGLRIPATTGPSDGRSWHFRSEIDPDRLPPLARVLELDDEALVEFQEARESVLIYAIGYLYVHRIGPEALRGLCLVAQSSELESVPLAWLHDAAGLRPDDPHSWRRAIEDLIGPAERSYILGTALERERDGRETFVVE